MFYTVFFFNEKYNWVFENKDATKTFKGTFSFVLQNLQIDGERPGSSQFKVEVGPGRTEVRSLSRLNPTKASKYKVSYSFSMNDSHGQMGAGQSEAMIE